MSESEKKKRLEYRRKREKLIFVQIIVAIVVAITVAISALAYFRINNDYYVGYTEKSSVDYKVYLKDNDFYDEEYLGSGMAYIAELIENVVADFDYSYKLDSKDVSYSATYEVKSQFVVTVNQSGKLLHKKENVIKPSTPVTVVNGNVVNIKEQVIVDYDQHNSIAQSLLNVYDLSGVTCTFNVVLSVDVSGSCADFENRKLSSHNVSLDMPFTKNIVDFKINTSVPHQESNTIICNQAANRNVFKLIAIIGSILEGLLLCGLVVFIFITRNHDINYEIKIKRLVAAYKSYIQKILTEFNFDGYQVLKVETFNEMLDIRDTVNLPILMSENTDKTCTTFMIPTNNNLLYLHEIKVEDYDEIYGDKSEIVYEEPVCEEIVCTEQPIVEETDTQTEINRRYRYTFLARLSMSADEIKDYCSTLKNHVLSYNKTRAKFSSSYESFYAGRDCVARFTVRGKTLYLYLPLDAKEYENSKYHPKDVSDVAKFRAVPMRIKVKSARGVKFATELIDIVAQKLQLQKNPDYVNKAYSPKTLSMDELLSAGLIIDLENKDKTPPIDYSILFDVPTEEVAATENKPDFYNGTKYDYSFTAKLHLASDETRAFYNEISAFVQSYGLKVSRSWSKERIQLGRKTYAILSFRGLKLAVSFAINPAEYENTKYKLKDVSSLKKFAQVPAQMKVTSSRKVNWVKELFNDMLSKDGVENKNLPANVAEIKPKSKQKLIKENLIKIG